MVTNLPIVPVFLPSRWWLFKAQLIQLQSIFSFLARFKYLLIFSLWSARMAKSTNWKIHFFLVNINTRSVLLAGIWRSMFISKYQRILHVLFPDLCILLFYFFYIQRWDRSPTKSKARRTSEGCSTRWDWKVRYGGPYMEEKEKSSALMG